MTLTRSVAIIGFSFLLLPFLPGQGTSPGVPGGTGGLESMVSVDSLAQDSTAASLAIPNVFTPNDDDINDYFEVETDGETVYEFTVFTRAGIRVFHSSSPRIFWDGRSLSGEELKQGIYYYTIEEVGNETHEQAGTIYLFR